MADLEIIDGELTAIGQGMQKAADALHSAKGSPEDWAQGEQAMPGGYSPRTLARVGRERDQELNEIATHLQRGSAEAFAKSKVFDSLDEALEQNFAQLMPGATSKG